MQILHIEAEPQAITFDVTEPSGYEAMRAALHGAGRYEDAIQTFEIMLSKIDQSPDPEIRGESGARFNDKDDLLTSLVDRRGQYVNPSSTRGMIRRIVQRTIRHSPRVLIDTNTGRLQSKAEQEAAFMSMPIVAELVSSMTTSIDRCRIKHEVRQFFRYVMFSHKWEEDEPLFQQVVPMVVYDLDDSPTHDKLKTFCKMVRDAGFEWAWSDTCCINKEDNSVLQEALVAMFKWYRGAAMVFVFLRGVHSAGKSGDLRSSLWNSRAWTLQEYVAARVIRFYTEDWMPYLNLEVFNHKESPEIILEMEQATRVSAQQLKNLRPGLSSIREKLRLASTRQTTRVEDAAYSLLGIFSVSGISAIYGEGEKALGRLLAHILAVSGDTSILAWTGQSGGHNSCLPAHITVFNRPATPHLLFPLEDAEIDKISRTLRTSALDLDLAIELYNHLKKLPAPWFASSRLKLPCIAFKLPPLSPHRTHSVDGSRGRVYRADTPFFGTVEIKTKRDPSRFNSLYLVHPWLDALLDREDMQSGAFVEDHDSESMSPRTDDEPSDAETEDNFSSAYSESSSMEDDEGDISDEEMEDGFLPFPESTPAHTDAASTDTENSALRLIARLRQPFGALLLSPKSESTRRRVEVYKRIAADGEITVQLRENVPLSDVLNNVRILDVL